MDLFSQILPNSCCVLLTSTKWKYCVKREVGVVEDGPLNLFCEFEPLFHLHFAYFAKVAIFTFLFFLGWVTAPIPTVAMKPGSIRAGDVFGNHRLLLVGVVLAYRSYHLILSRPRIRCELSQRSSLQTKPLDLLTLSFVCRIFTTR